MYVFFRFHIKMALRRLLKTHALPMSLRCLSEVAKVEPTKLVIPSASDQMNPIPGYNYIKTESHPVPGFQFVEPPTVDTGIHAITGEVVKFPYMHCKDACYDPNVAIKYVLISNFL